MYIYVKVYKKVKLNSTLKGNINIYQPKAFFFLQITPDKRDKELLWYIAQNTYFVCPK